MEVIDFRMVAEIPKTGVGKAFEFCWLGGIDLRKITQMGEPGLWLEWKWGKQGDGGGEPADKAMPFFSAS